MTENWGSLCFQKHPLFSQAIVQENQTNFFAGVSLGAFRESRNKRLQERQSFFSEMAGRATNFSTSSETREQHVFGGNIFPGTTSGQLIEPGLLRLHKSYDLVKKVGEGSFGKVYQARDRASGALRAVKITNLKSILSLT